MFTIARTDLLRVYVYVPQTYAGRIKPGLAVEVRQAELPGQVFRGSVARTAGAIDPATRTLQVRVELPNGALRLKPAMFASIRAARA